LQGDALEHAGCDRVFTDAASDAATARPALDQILDQLRPGDTLVVWSWTGWAGLEGRNGSLT
jgi:DNA invertase Pin-like site-specific DNA recombinase